MLIPDLRVSAIKSEGVAAWTIVTVEFEWLNGVYFGDAQWPDAVAVAALVMESEEWQAYWRRPRFVVREEYDGGRLLRLAVVRPESAEAFTSRCLTKRGGWVSYHSR